MTDRQLMELFKCAEGTLVASMQKKDKHRLPAGTYGDYEDCYDSGKVVIPMGTLGFIMAKSEKVPPHMMVNKDDWYTKKVNKLIDDFYDNVEQKLELVGSIELGGKKFVKLENRTAGGFAYMNSVIYNKFMKGKMAAYQGTNLHSPIYFCEPFGELYGCFCPIRLREDLMYDRP